MRQRRLTKISTHTTTLTKGTRTLRKFVLKATEHSGRFVLNDSARTRPSSWRRCDDVLDYIWRQKMLLQDKTSKIEKLQQLLHSERQRMELLIGAVLVCVFLLSFLKALRDWLLPRIHGEVQGVPVRAIRGAVPAARLVRELLSTPRRLTTSRLAFSEVLRRES